MAGQSKDRLGRFGALVLGGILGAIGGLLLAPRSGQETREQIRGRANKLKEEALGRYEEQRERIRERSVEQSEELKGRIIDMRERLLAGVESVAGTVKESISRGAEKAEEVVEAREEKMEKPTEEELEKPRQEELGEPRKEEQA